MIGYHTAAKLEAGMVMGALQEERSKKALCLLVCNEGEGKEVPIVVVGKLVNYMLSCFLGDVVESTQLSSLSLHSNSLPIISIEVR